MDVLSFFHGLAAETVNIQNSIIDRIINTNTEKLVELFSIELDKTRPVYQVYHVVKGYSAEEVFLKACGEMLRFMLIEIERYKSFQQKHEIKDRLQDIIDNM